MPYFAPLAAIPITSCAPRLAEMKARPVIQVARLLPEWKKSRLVFVTRFSAAPMARTNAK